MRRMKHVLVAAGLLCLLVVAADAQQFGFAAPRQFDAGSTIAGLAVRDVDSDGLVDIASVSTPRTLTIRRKDAYQPGTPYDQQTYTTETLDVGAAVSDMAVGPTLYGNSFPDFAFAAGGNVVLVTNAGPGAAPNTQLQLAVQTPLSAGAGIVLDRVRIANWDGVGGLDIVATGLDASSRGVLVVFLNDAGGVLGAFGPPTVTTLAHPVFGLLVSDFTFDGVGDAAVAYRADDAVGVLSGDGAGGAVAETIVNVPFHPEAMSVGVFDHSRAYFYPDLLIAGSGRSADGTKNEIQCAVVQNLAVIRTKAPAFGAATTFRLPGVTGADDIRPTDVSAIDMSGDGYAEVLVADDLNGAVAVLSPIPTYAAGVVTSWGSLAVREFACNGEPTRVTHAGLVGSSYTDVVTGNDSGNGVNALIGGAPATPLNAATNLTFALGSGSKYATVKTGATLKNGSNCRFTCRNGNAAGTFGLRIRVQATTTPEAAGSWADLPGAAAGDMGQDVNTGDFVLFQQNFPIGAAYFRTVTSAPGAGDGVEAPIGPFTIVGGQPAHLVLFSSVRRTDDTVPATTRPGETLRVVLTYRNEGDVATTADLWAQIPAGCTVSNANGGAPFPKKNPVWLVWPKILVPAHSGDVNRTFDVTVGDASNIGKIVESRYTAIATKLKLALDKKTGELKPVKDTVAVALVNNSVPIVGDLSVTITPSPTSQRVGGEITLNVAVTNETASAIANVRFVEHLRRDVEARGGVYLDSNGNPTAVPPDIDATGTVFTFTWSSIAAGATVRAQIYVHSTWDHEASGTITVSDHELFGTLAAGGAAVMDTHPAPVTVEIDLPATDPAPRLQLSAGLASLDRPDPYVSPSFGELPFALPGDAVQYYFLVENVGNDAAHHVALHAYVPAGLDLDMSSFASAFPFQVTSPTGVGFVHGPTNVTMELLNIPDDGVLRFYGYKVKVRDDAGAPVPGTILTSDFGSLSSNSFRDPIYMRPEQLRLLVPEQMKFAVTKTVSTSGLAKDETMTFSYAIQATGPVGAQGATAAFGFPKYETCLGATLDDAPVTATQSKGLCTYALGDFAKDQAKTFVVSVRLASIPPATLNLVNTLSVSGLASTKAGGALPVVTLDVETTNVCDPSNACLFVVAAVDALATRVAGGGPAYVIAVGNTSGQTAKSVVVRASLPDGVRVLSLASGSADSSVSKGVVTWKIGELAPHSAQTVAFELAADLGTLAVGDTIVEEISVSAANAPTKLSGRLAATLFETDDLYGAIAGSRALLVNGVPYKPGTNPAVDGAFSAMSADTLNVQLRGADFVKLGDDVFAIPLGAGNVLAFGAGTKVFAPPGGGATNLAGDVRVHHGTDVFNFTSGAAPGIRVTVNGCQTISTVGDALDQIGPLVACKSATIVSNGSGTLVNLLGTKLVSNLDGSLLGQLALTAGAGVIAQGGGNIIAAGGGNIIAAGGGNVIAQGGGNLAATGLASLVLATPSMVIASGGGNVIAQGGGNVIAQGGGNVIAQGGGNVISQGGGNLIAAGGGNVIAQGGGNVIAQGGGNLVSTNGGNVIAQGGGNVIAQGGGNVIAQGGGN